MVVSNTYIEPTAGTALNTARGNFNDALRAVLTNFKSIGTPGSAQIKIDDVFLGEQDGMLYRSAKTNALYISDSVHKKTTPIGGNFTRWGIGHRIEPSATSFNSAAIRPLYEIGELVGVLDTGKLYIRNSNTDASTSFVDVGTTQGYTVSTPYSNATFSGQSLTAINMIATSSISLGTNSPTQGLDIRANATISGNVFVGSSLYAPTINIPNSSNQLSLSLTQNQINTIGYNGISSIAVNYVGYASGSTQFRDLIVYNGKSNPIATFTGSTGNLAVTGIITAYSDERLKTNVKTIDNALNKVLQLRGVSFIKDDTSSIGVIAQEVEKVIPEVVVTNEYKSVAYGNLVGLLIEAIKELKKEVDNLRGAK